MTVAELRDALAEIDGDVRVNVVVGNDDWDTYSGWEPELFHWEPGEEHVILFAHEDDNASIDPDGRDE